MVEADHKIRKVRADKGVPRKKRVKAVAEEVPLPQVATPSTEPKPEKISTPKKKTRKRKNFRYRGVYLTPLSKPLGRKTPEGPEPPDAEDNQE